MRKILTLTLVILAVSPAIASQDQVYQRRQAEITRLLPNSIPLNQGNSSRIALSLALLTTSLEAWNPSYSSQSVMGFLKADLEKSGSQHIANVGLALIDLSAMTQRPEIGRLANTAIEIVNPSLAAYVSLELGSSPYSGSQAETPTAFYAHAVQQSGIQKAESASNIVHAPKGFSDVLYGAGSALKSPHLNAESMVAESNFVTSAHGSISGLTKESCERQCEWDGGTKAIGTAMKESPTVVAAALSKNTALIASTVLAAGNAVVTSYYETRNHCSSERCQSLPDDPKETSEPTAAAPPAKPEKTPPPRPTPTATKSAEEEKKTEKSSPKSTGPSPKKEIQPLDDSDEDTRKPKRFDRESFIQPPSNNASRITPGSRSGLPIQIQPDQPSGDPCLSSHYCRQPFGKDGRF